MLRVQAQIVPAGEMGNLFLHDFIRFRLNKMFTIRLTVLSKLQPRTTPSRIGA